MARPKPAATRLDEAIAAHDEAQRKHVELQTARSRALLSDDEPTALKLGVEIEALEHVVRNRRDKIELLRAPCQRAHQVDRTDRVATRRT